MFFLILGRWSEVFTSPQDEVKTRESDRIPPPPQIETSYLNEVFLNTVPLQTDSSRLPHAGLNSD